MQHAGAPCSLRVQLPPRQYLSRLLERRRGGPGHQLARHNSRSSFGRAVRLAPKAAAPLIYGPEVEALLADFLIEEALPDGRLVFRPLGEEDASAASVVLTRSFATSLQGIPLKDGRGYIHEMLMQQPPGGVLLVARLFPTDASLLREGAESRVVATASLSFNRDTREEFPSLQPPDAAAYLCNMAVEPRFRRRGYARRMLAACEALATARNFEEVYLHARLGDDPALQLYEASGYRIVDEDSWLVKLRGVTPRALLAKRLLPPG